MVQFNNSWDILLKDEFQKPYYLNLRKFLVQEYKSQTIYPNMNDIFNALKYTDYKDVKVVILGQDPYHQPNQAHGLCFSVLKGVKAPPSLQNMYKEIYAEYGYPVPDHGELTYWAKQGVDVRVITPGIPDKKIVYSVTRSYYNSLARNGVRIYEWTPGFCHCKMCITDDKAATCGTINLNVPAKSAFLLSTLIVIGTVTPYAYVPLIPELIFN